MAVGDPSSENGYVLMVVGLRYVLKLWSAKGNNKGGGAIFLHFLPVAGYWCLSDLTGMQ